MNPKLRQFLPLLVLVCLLGRGAPAAVAQDPGAEQFETTVEQPLRETMSIQEIIKTGGVPMYILGAMSVIGLALVLYFLAELREQRVMPRKLIDELGRLLSADRLEDARQACMGSRSALAVVALTAIEHTRNTDSTSPELLREVIEGEGGRQATMIQNQIQYLQDIAAIAPMIGLLGTVLGMLTAFNSVALDIAKAKPMVLAGGVSQALITTAAGLIVGIPAMIAYAYFRGRTARLISGLESAAADLLTLLLRKRSS